MAKKTTEATTPKRGRGRPKGSKNKPKKITRVALVIDRSGSMQSVQQAAFNGINEQIATIKKNAKLTGKTFVTYIQFDDVVETVFENKAVKELTPITSDQYAPRGTTALRDATFAAIKSLQAASGKDGDDTGYLVIVISDGWENASKDITPEQLKDEITKLEATGKWTFTYMLSNVDVNVVSNSLGVSLQNCATYDSSLVGTAQAFSQMSGSYANYATMRSAHLTATKNFYNSGTGGANNS